MIKFEKGIKARFLKREKLIKNERQTTGIGLINLQIDNFKYIGIHK